MRCYRLHGPHIPTQKPYRFMLATRSTTRIVAHERPDLIEVGSAWCAPWLVHLATRGLRRARGVVLPQQLSPHHRAAPARGGLGASHRQRPGVALRAPARADWCRPPSRPAGRWCASWRAPGSTTWSTCRWAWTSTGSPRPRRARAAETRRRFGLPGGAARALRRPARGGEGHRPAARGRGWRSSGAPARDWRWSVRGRRPLAAADPGREARHLAALPAGPGSARRSLRRDGSRGRARLGGDLRALGARGAGQRRCRCSRWIAAAWPRPSAARARAASTPPATAGHLAEVRRRAASTQDLPALGRDRAALRRGAPRVGHGASTASSMSTDGCQVSP